MTLLPPKSTPRLFTLAVVLSLALQPSVRAAAGDVTMILNGEPAKVGDYKPGDVQSLVMDNGLLKATFGKQIEDTVARDASETFGMTSLIKNGTELVHNLNGKEGRDPYRHITWYVDYGGSAGRLVPDNVRIVSNTPEMAHFAVIDDRALTGGGARYYLEHHIIMRKGVSGLYGYVVLNTPRAAGINELRTMYRFDRGIFDWAYNDERIGQQPTYAECADWRDAGDETWVLPEGSPYRKFTGTLYQKYDYSAYYSESLMFGHYGHGFGAFFIPVSNEYYGGGPLKQELIIHQDALILNYIQGEHYGAGNLQTWNGYEKLFGPWLVYINAVDPKDPNAAGKLIADGLKMAKEQQSQWPFAWMDDPRYPLQRTTVSGQLKVADGRSAANAWVVLAQPSDGNPRWDVYHQMGDFIFYTKADAHGNFTLPNVRSGTYALHAWATQGPITNVFEKPGIEVKGDKLNLGELVWTPPHHNNFLWQIGQSDHMAGEFKFGNGSRSRTWVQNVPGDLIYTIGQSKPDEAWYYAQGRPGNWDVNFDLAKTYTGNAYLSVPVAGGSGTVNISLNGTDIGRIQKGNDSSIPRATMRSGVYQDNEFIFPVSLLKQGKNTLRFSMSNSGGLMYDTVVLEVD